MQNKVLKCKTIFNSVSETFENDIYIFIKGNLIEKLEKIENSPSLDGYQLIDMGDKLVTPGLTDCHAHICLDGSLDHSFLHKTIGDTTLRGLKLAQENLMAGFTSLRILGDRGFGDVAVRDAIDKGDFIGPRLVVSGPCLGTTGSHADTHNNPYTVENESLGVIANGKAGLQEAARYVLKHGADMIKFMATGGGLSRGTKIGAQQMTFEEMCAVVEIADMYGVPVAVHAHGTDGIKSAIKAGVKSIEHATTLDDECIEEMIKRGTYIVPTFCAPHFIISKGVENGFPEYAVEKTKETQLTHGSGFRKAKAAGVNIAFGTDIGTPFNRHGKQALEFKLLMDNGLTTEEALTSATKSASKLIGKWDTQGSLEKGKFADIAAFEGDIKSDILTMTRCKFVMKNGEVVKNIL